MKYDKMSLTMDTDFPRWLAEQRRERRWSQSDLARAAKINRQVVNDYEGYKRKTYDDEILKKIAKAFKLPVETIYRAAGKLPPRKEIDETIEEIMYQIRDLPLEEKINVREYVRLRLRLAEEKAEYEASLHIKTKPRPSTS